MPVLGQPGQPEWNRLASPTKITSVKVTDVVLANYAEMRDGLAFITGGFPDYLTAISPNYSPRIGMVVVVDYEPVEIGMAFHFLVRLVHPDGDADTVVKIGTAPQLKPNHPDFAPIRQVVTVSSLPVEFRMSGLHEFRVVDENSGELYYSVSLGVAIGMPGNDYKVRQPPDSVQRPVTAYRTGTEPLGTTETGESKDST